MAETVKGSAEMVLKSGEAPWPLVDQVCSPGGTTIEGVTTLQAKGFEAAAVAAFDAVLEKDKKIGRGKVKKTALDVLCEKRLKGKYFIFFTFTRKLTKFH